MLPKKTKRKATASGYNTPVREKRPPRPLKLKPLKEVLTKLISQIKKKDDYAFFLKPVDASKVPGYADIVRHPMDFGTMTTKVARGRYRSLEEFADDFRLVINNAKSFNPPGTIYFNEAQRIETWGLEHIAKASATVIQYETDWNIEVEKDDEPDMNNGMDVDVDAMDVDTPGAREMSATPGPPNFSSSRRTRAPYRKAAAPSGPSTKPVQEAIDSEGRLPGSKDGLGAFPAGSDWAKAMVALKLKGKRYKTKKERLKIEKEGPPLRLDGSLDYFEMEDPFPTLSALVPDPPSRPYLVPLYPPLFPSTSQLSTQSQTPQPPAQFPTAVNLPRDRPPIEDLPSERSTKFKHWTIQRNANSRNRPKDKEDERDENDDLDWKAPREAHPTDFGSFTLLAAEIAEEMKRRGSFKDEEEGTFSLIRAGLEPELVPNRPVEKNKAVSPLQHYWSINRAIEGEGYIRDVVYGGPAGLAYLRSVAEFMTPPTEPPHSSAVLDMSLESWTQNNVLDPLTETRHSLLRRTPYAMKQVAESKDIAQILNSDPIISQVAKSMRVYPIATQSLLALQAIRLHKIDMSSLIKAPNELFQSDDEVGGKYLEGKPSILDSGLQMPNRLDQVLSYVARLILDSSRKLAKAPGGSGGDSTIESETLRRLRLNLLALAKRAPLDTIARLPRELVPEHLRQIIPTFAVSQVALPPVSTSAVQTATPTPAQAQAQPASAGSSPSTQVAAPQLPTGIQVQPGTTPSPTQPPSVVAS